MGYYKNELCLLITGGLLESPSSQEVSTPAILHKAHNKPHLVHQRETFWEGNG